MQYRQEGWWGNLNRLKGWSETCLVEFGPRLRRRLEFFMCPVLSKLALCASLDLGFVRAGVPAA